MDVNEKWATHRTFDPIGLLKVKVSMKRTRQSVIHTQADAEQADHNSNNDETESESQNITHGSDISDHENDNDNNNDNSQNRRDGSQITNDDRVESTIGWQIRIYSPTEVNDYLNKKQLPPKIEEGIRAKLDEDPSYRGEEIFTRINEDHYIDPSEIDKPFRNRTGGKPTELASAILDGKGDEELVDIVQTTAQSMHIFASVTSVDGSQYEQLLAIIRAYPGGRIDVRPPFSNKCNPPMVYKFEIPRGGTINYTIDIDEDKADEETPFERTLLGDIKRRRAIFDAALTDCSLAHPPENAKAIRMFYRGEISTCEMFEAENVAVEYNIKFPPGWTLEDNNVELFGCSQLADCRDIDGVAYINLPIDIEALCETQVAPTLQVVLHSYTEMNSRIVVGYGSVQLPMTRGCHTLTFDVWRVRGTVLEELKLQFLESGLEIQPFVESGMSDLLSEPSPESSIPTNKFGLRTIGTGKVTVKFNLAMQSAQFRLRQAAQSQPPMSSLGALSARDPNSRISLLMNNNNNSRLNNI